MSSPESLQDSLPESLLEQLRRVDAFFSDFYPQLAVRPEPHEYLLAPCPSLKLGGEVVLLEADDAYEIGIRFGQDLVNIFATSGAPGEHELGILAEELSHFWALAEAAQHETHLSPLDLEILGEIDRFLFLFSQEHSVYTQRLNRLCDKVFQERSFTPNPDSIDLYLKAESIALKHILRAFRCEWNVAPHPQAQDISEADYRSYFCQLREHVVCHGASARLLLEQTFIA